jgi:hypothetical protein
MCLTKQEAVWGTDVQIHVYLTTALVGGGRSTSHTGCFTPKESDPAINCIRGWVGPKASGENSSPYQNSNSDPSVLQPVASRCTD